MWIRRVQSDVTELNWTELNWHGIVFDELANGQAGQAYWSLIDAYVNVVT